MKAQRPETLEEMVEQLWYAVMGSNGQSLITRIENIEHSLRPDNRLLHCPLRKEMADREEGRSAAVSASRRESDRRRDRRELTLSLVKDFILVAIAIGGLLFGSGIIGGP